MSGAEPHATQREVRRRKTAHDPGEHHPSTRRGPSQTEVRERIRKIRVDLEIYRLPSPERLQLLEELARCQHELIVQLSEKAARA